MRFSFWMKPEAKKRNEAAKKIYNAVVEQSRQPVFYDTLKVPDTFTGRFEMVALHMSLIIDRLYNEQTDSRPEASTLAQAVFDEMFATLDLTIRELGVGDVGVPKHMKRMMKALKGRAQAYIQGYHHSQEALGEALRRNLFATVQEDLPQPAIDAMMAYMSVLIQSLRVQDFEKISVGDIAFPTIRIETRQDAA